ncbi:SDR family NAD(P)-dependent oxidoreductase [Reichenbachiella versicolor]|uniref:SDR family NAD(P)-dependent oxidoreductase n=1 Tax=Reichenbachiella versicolor TaxID=1821036 RepID=UPI000D6DC8B1|nr:glucose 1-dehydrogenase [Reichenbachiella versicolor]
MTKLNNKVAVITGGNSGIGLATVKLFLAEGAKVVFSGRRQEALDEVSKELSGDFLAVKSDASSVEESAQLIEAAVNKYGKIDILFLNAGIAPLAPISDITPEHFDAVFETNVKGPFFTIKAAIPQLKDGGVIITNTSIVHQKGFEGIGVYSASKGALRSLSRVLANELHTRQIRTVSVAPGPIQTPIYDKMGMPQEQLDEFGASMAQAIPLKRFGVPEEIAKTVLFLASDDASYINGVEFEVDGGLSQV